MKKYLQKRHHEQQTAMAATATMHSTLEAVEHVQAGSFYEIDSSKLPPETPQHLKSICIVLVSKKALSKVWLSFPSSQSLQSFFDVGIHQTRLPALDAKYLLDPHTAAEVLYRRVPPKEISDRRKVWTFWTVAKRRRFDDRIGTPVGCGKERTPCLIRWGRRKRVRYVNLKPPASSDDDGRKEERAETEDERVETEEEDKAAVVVFRRSNMKNAERPRRAKSTNKGKQIVVHNQSGKQLVKKASIARWSAGRYHSAEENMLKVMKAMGATAGKTISRLALRNEARKLIGDTGLLDHLLKHMAGKVAPGGAERFRRRHNADGAMEYWLESAELEDIRKEAGVEDPYWTPPQGWKPGDNPTQDPTCARMIKELWEEITSMKKSDQGFKEPADQDLAMVTSSCLNTLEMDPLLTHLKEKYRQLVVMKSKMEDHMGQVDEFLTGLEEEMRVLKSPGEAQPALICHSEEAEERAVTNNGRLKSGFRTYRPQGTVVWPNMSSSMSQHRIDPSAVPSTPCVASSSKSATQLVLALNPGSGSGSGSGSWSIVKPLAERRALNMSTLLCPAPTPVPPTEIENATAKSQSAKTIQINLNEIPADGQNSDSTTISEIFTYQRKRKMTAKKEMNAY